MASVANDQRVNPTTALPPMEVLAENEPETNKTTAIVTKRVLLVLSCVLLIVGCCGGPLITRLYFLHGGKLVWLSSWLQSAGCPFTLIPLTVSYLRRSSANANTKIFYAKPLVFFSTAVIGVLTGLDNYLYTYGLARVPVSTGSLIFASQLAFTAVFACLLVRQKFSPYSINAVVLMTVGSVILALHTSGDKPRNETNKQYSFGFIMTLVASFLYGLILPLIEFTYVKAKQEITYTLVMEIQLVMGLFATVFCTIGLFATNEFQAIVGEAREFGIGESRYYVVLVSNAIIWQCFYAGAVGVIFCSSSLFSGVIIAALLPVTEVLAVIFYRERFSGEKGVSLGISLWGFLSYFYGEATQSRKQRKKKNNHLVPETESLPPHETTIIPNPTSSV